MLKNLNVTQNSIIQKATQPSLCANVARPISNIYKTYAKNNKLTQSNVEKKEQAKQYQDFGRLYILWKNNGRM